MFYQCWYRYKKCILLVQFNIKIDQDFVVSFLIKKYIETLILRIILMRFYSIIYENLPFSPFTKLYLLKILNAHFWQPGAEKFRRYQCYQLHIIIYHNNQLLWLQQERNPPPATTNPVRKFNLKVVPCVLNGCIITHTPK